MDELFRLTPEERRRRRILWIAGAGLAVLVVLLIAGVKGARAWLRKQAEPVPPSAYLVATDPGVTVRIDGRDMPLADTIAVPSGAAIELPAGARAGILYPKSGYVETLAGPAAVTPPAPAQPKKDGVDFLASPREALITARYRGPGESTGRVLVTSPFGVTRFTNPTITWEPRPRVRYDVAVIDPSDPDAPPRVARDLLPPVRIDQLDTTMPRMLEPDRIYNVIVRESGSPTQVGGMRFLVATDATDAAFPLAPDDLLVEAAAALATKPARIGDAWLALSRLPSDWAESELALRLRMRAAAELGLYDEIEKIQQALRQFGPSSGK